ncbi:hypothetical protein QOT17_016670 [Balamuthia mandrillaris]
MTTHNLNEKELEEIETRLKQLERKEGVAGVLVVDLEGVLVHSTFPPAESAQYAQQALPFLPHARQMLAAVLPSAKEELELVRLRSKTFELILISGEKYIMITLHKPAHTSK